MWNVELGYMALVGFLGRSRKEDIWGTKPMVVLDTFSTNVVLPFL